MSNPLLPSHEFSLIHTMFNPTHPSPLKGKEKESSGDSHSEEEIGIGGERRDSYVSYPYPDSDSDSDSDVEDKSVYHFSIEECTDLEFKLEMAFIDEESSEFVQAPPCTSTHKKRRLLISDRCDFTDSRKFSSKTFIEEHPFYPTIYNYINPTFRHEFKKEEDAKIFSNRRTVVLVHGFTVKFEDALRMLGKVSDKVKSTYDIIIGYTYPACENVTEYRKAKKNGLRAAKERLSKVLESIASSKPECLDIIAHSLGTIVAMHALNQPNSPRINNLFLLGGAVEEKSIVKNDSPLERALSNANKIYALYSCKDRVLPWLNLYLSPRPTGLPGKDIKDLIFAENVCLINTSLVIQGHSCYFEREEVFKFFKLIAKEVSLKGYYFSMRTKELSVTEPEGCAIGVKEAIVEGMSIAEKASKKQIMKLKFWKKLNVRKPSKRLSYKDT